MMRVVGGDVSGMETAFTGALPSSSTDYRTCLLLDGPKFRAKVFHILVVQSDEFGALPAGHG